MERQFRPTWARVIVLVMLFAALVPVGLPGAAHACTCADARPVDEQFASADAVFVGEAIEVRTAPVGDPAEFERRYVFRVTDVFKGQVYAQQSVVSSTEESHCGLPWDEAGAIALVYGYVQGSATAVPGEFSTSTCTTGPLGALPDSPAFASATEPLAGASPIGVAPQPPGEGGSAHFTWAWAAVGVLLLAGVAVGAWPRPRRDAHVLVDPRA